MDEKIPSAVSERILSGMKLPTLEHLHGPLGPNSAVSSLIRNSSCTLKSISLILPLGTAKREQQLKKFLAEIPTLETLGLGSGDSVDFLFEHLADTAITDRPYPYKSYFLPNLRIIKLDAVMFQWMSFLDLLSSHQLDPTYLRTFKGRPLRSLQISQFDLGLMNVDFLLITKHVPEAISYSIIDVTIVVSGPWKLGDQLHSDAVPFGDFLMLQND